MLCYAQHRSRTKYHRENYTMTNNDIIRVHKPAPEQKREVDFNNSAGKGFVCEGDIYLTRCGKCHKENYATVVASGQCAWCGNKPTIFEVMT